MHPNIDLAAPKQAQCYIDGSANLADSPMYMYYRSVPHTLVPNQAMHEHKLSATIIVLNARQDCHGLLLGAMSEQQARYSSYKL